jgi:hypothetical protein
MVSGPIFSGPLVFFMMIITLFGFFRRLIINGRLLIQSGFLIDSNIIIISIVIHNCTLLNFSVLVDCFFISAASLLALIIIAISIIFISIIENRILHSIARLVQFFVYATSLIDISILDNIAGLTYFNSVVFTIIFHICILLNVRILINLFFIHCTGSFNSSINVSILLSIPGLINCDFVMVASIIDYRILINS